MCDTKMLIILPTKEKNVYHSRGKESLSFANPGPLPRKNAPTSLMLLK
jgi:hypothetical protein